MLRSCDERGDGILGRGFLRPYTSPVTPAALVTRVIGLVVLAGAAAKLFFGTPTDLPQLARDLPLDTALTFRLVIALELVVGALALLRPSRGWLPALVLLLGFVVVLVVQIAQGENSCGCAGTLVIIPPEVMLALDAVLLILELLTKPWRRRAHRFQVPWPVFALVALGLVALPWIHDREVKDGPGSGGGYLVLRPEEWVGQPLSATQLHPWLSEEQRVADGVIVIWRESCEVCADHLARLATEEQGERTVVLLKLPKEYEDEEQAVFVLPEGFWVVPSDLPDTVQWVVTPPVHVEVVGGIVKVALEGMDVIR